MVSCFWNPCLPGLPDLFNYLQSSWGWPCSKGHSVKLYHNHVLQHSVMCELSALEAPGQQGSSLSLSVRKPVPPSQQDYLQAISQAHSHHPGHQLWEEGSTQGVGKVSGGESIFRNIPRVEVTPFLILYPYQWVS